MINSPVRSQLLIVGVRQQIKLVIFAMCLSIGFQVVAVILAIISINDRSDRWVYNYSEGSDQIEFTAQNDKFIVTETRTWSRTLREPVVTPLSLLGRYPAKYVPEFTTKIDCASRDSMRKSAGRAVELYGANALQYSEPFSFWSRTPKKQMTSWLLSTDYASTNSIGVPIRWLHISKCYLDTLSGTSVTCSRPDHGIQLRVLPNIIIQVQPLALITSVALVAFVPLAARISFVQLLRWRRHQLGCCPRCGYSRIGIDQSICPECGILYRSFEL